MGQKEKQARGKFLAKHETEENWNKSSYVPDKGEHVIYDPDEKNLYPRVKYGDGQNIVKDLPFAYATKEIEGQANGTLSVSITDASPVEHEMKVQLLTETDSLISVEKGNFWDSENGSWYDVPQGTYKISTVSETGWNDGSEHWYTVIRFEEAGIPSYCIYDWPDYDDDGNVIIGDPPVYDIQPGDYMIYEYLDAEAVYFKRKITTPKVVIKPLNLNDYFSQPDVYYTEDISIGFHKIVRIENDYDEYGCNVYFEDESNFHCDWLIEEAKLNTWLYYDGMGNAEMDDGETYTLPLFYDCRFVDPSEVKVKVYGEDSSNYTVYTPDANGVATIKSIYPVTNINADTGMEVEYLKNINEALGIMPNDNPDFALVVNSQIKDFVKKDEIDIEVDTALSTTSENPVQNKVITNALNNKMDKNPTEIVINNGDVTIGSDDGQESGIYGGFIEVTNSDYNGYTSIKPGEIHINDGIEDTGIKLTDYNIEYHLEHYKQYSKTWEELLSIEMAYKIKANATINNSDGGDAYAKFGNGGEEVFTDTYYKVSRVYETEYYYDGEYYETDPYTYDLTPNGSGYVVLLEVEGDTGMPVGILFFTNPPTVEDYVCVESSTNDVYVGIPKSLPDTTPSDNGKIIQVDSSGKWTKSDALNSKMDKNPNEITIGSDDYGTDFVTLGVKDEYEGIVSLNEVDGYRNIEISTTGGIKYTNSEYASEGTTVELQKSWEELLSPSSGGGLTCTESTITTGGATWHRTKWSNGKYECRCTVKPSEAASSFTVTFPDAVTNPHVTYSVMNGSLSFNTTCTTTSTTFKMSYDVGAIKEINLLILGTVNN